jgi:6-phosphofructokinase
VRIGILTGGGDCPGLNAVIRAVVRRVERDHDGTVLGFRDGWNGVIEDDAIDLDVEACRGLLPRGGTVLGTSRIQPFGVEGGVEACRSTLEARGVDALVVVGGEGTLSCAREMHDDGFPVVGVPKTIDNDIAGTEFTFGFATAVEIATESIDRLHTTAESHDRVMVVEVMGRHVGHCHGHAGSGGALRHRRGLRAGPAPPQPWPLRIDRRGRRGCRPGGGDDRSARTRTRPLRPCTARGHRPPDRCRDPVPDVL